MAEKTMLLTDWTFEYKDKKWTATVPGDISNDLMKNNIIEDVLFSDNYKKSAWVHERGWTYCTTFNLTDEHLKAERLEIVFNGVDTYAQIYINDKLLGKTENMFIQYIFDIKPFVNSKENIIKVDFSPIRDVKANYKNDKYLSCFDDNRMFMRKVQCHFGWDWAPNFPGLGLYEDVHLRWGDNKNLEWIQVIANNNGDVSFITELTAHDEKGLITVEVEKTPNQGFLDAHISTSEIIGKKNITNVYVKNPELWYPIGYGASPIYNYRVTVDYGTSKSQKTGHFSFREFRIEEKPYDNDKISFDMFVNDVPFKVVGSNWVPASIMTGCLTDENYDDLLVAARDGGINMLRVWGGGLYEKQAFYDKCDKYGITVWQDFMFSCCDVPDDNQDFVKLIQDEATYQIKRLRNHPSIVIWCGGNELTDGFNYVKKPFGKYINRVLLAGLTHDLDGTRRYLWDSPYSFTDVGNHSTSGDCHKNALAVATAHNDIINFRKYQFDNDNAFDTECAVLGLCRLRSLKCFMPEDRIWPQNDLWEDRFSCNPYDDSVVSFTERLTMNVNSMFGKYNGLADFVKKSMTVHAGVLQSEIEYFRSIEKNSGIMNWMYNDIWGNGTWSIIDYQGEKKPAYYATKRAGKRLNLSIVMKKDGYKVFVVNDTAKKYEAPIILSHQMLDGKIINTKEFKAKVNPFSIQSFDIDFDSSVKNGFWYAKSGKLNTVYFYDLWKDKEFITDIATNIKLNDDKKSGSIKISANKFARMVFVDFPIGIKVNLSDNYLDIPQGETENIEFTCSSTIDKKDIKVLTFADEWAE